VGDCFDVAFVTRLAHSTHGESLRFASLVAGEYAATTTPEVFKEGVRALQSIEASIIHELVGISLPWEERCGHQIYMAAPDFEGVDTRLLEEAIIALQYHNFAPRAPIRENGEASDETNDLDKVALAKKDLALLAQCDSMMAVMLYNDPGTIAEIGIAFERGLPVIILDPYGLVDNLMLRGCARYIVSSLGEAIDAVFKVYGREI